MNLDTQQFLRLVEANHTLHFIDTESQGREGDYGRMYVVSSKPYGKSSVTLSLGENLCDRGLMRDAKVLLEQAAAWVTFYGKGHDVPLINTRLIRWGYKPLEPRPHIDLYYQLKYKLKTGRKSQAHLLEFLEDTMRVMGIEPQHKMTVSPNTWSDLPTRFSRNIKILRDRCASDVAGLEALYRVTSHLIRDVKC